MADTTPIARLRRLAKMLEASGHPDAAWLAEGIDAYQAQAGDGVTLDAVLGLSRRGGAGPWWVAEARQRRDAAVRELRAVLFPALAPADAATAIKSLVRRRQSRATAARTTEDLLADRVLGSGVPLPGTRKRLTAILQDPP